jgi:mono/diheme cytochrome c family protein
MKICTPRFALLMLGFSLFAPRSSADDLPRQAYDILKKNCFGCHGASKAAGLDLRTHQSIMTGGERGPAVMAANPSRSPLYVFVTHQQKPAMPPGQKLSDADIDTLRRWIVAGASLDGVEGATSPDEKQRKAELAKLEERPITPEERANWAFRKPVRPAIPSSAEHPVDAFLLARQHDKGLKPVARADRRTLVRRAYLDLIGIPPSPSEVEAFLKDTAPDAWPRLVDKLLASPHYGERWGRHWLDLVRYADSGGFEYDVDWPNAWRYRDYVVAAFNQDKPYDQFIREQIAGDEIAPDSKEALIATGYLRLGPQNNIRNERIRMDELDDLVQTTSLAFLGLTVGCARCHNHKFDPIPQKDYYRMQAVFFSTKNVDYPLAAEDAIAKYKAAMAAIDARLEPLKKAKSELEEPYRQRLFDEKLAALPEYMQVAWRTPASKRTDGQKLNARQIEGTLKFKDEELAAAMTAEDRIRQEDLIAQMKRLDKQRPEPYAMAMGIGEEGRDALPSYFLHRGSPDVKGSLMKPGVISVLCDGEVNFAEPPGTSKSSWRRRGLAEWIASKENPLTARVMVNRIWQQHFGEGIVRTPSNFGKTGQPASHPELLDWLAVEFMEKSWSLKAMHRLMMTSDAYQASSDDLMANVEIDPENRLFWRMPRQRLQAETIRDAVLAAAGTLDRTTGGPAVYPWIDPDLFQSSTKRTWPGKPDSDPSTWRRSLYVYSKRSIRYPLFETFDQPDMISSCDRRNRSTIAPQALLLMNNAFVIEQSEHFARRIEREAGTDVSRQVHRAFELALSRAPKQSEKNAALKYLKDNPKGLAAFCQAMFNLNEFVYRQ